MDGPRAAIAQLDLGSYRFVLRQRSQIDLRRNDLDRALPRGLGLLAAAMDYQEEREAQTRQSGSDEMTGGFPPLSR